MAALAEAYIHLKPYHLDTGNIDRITDSLEVLSKKIARSLYDRPIDLELRIEEGSLKAWLTIVGGIIGTVYGALADYRDVKAGVQELVRDAREFGDQLFPQFFEREDVTSDQVYRTERRLMTPGRIHRVITRLEDTQRRLPALSNNETFAIMESIKVDLYRIQSELDSEQEMAVILHALPRDKLPQLPKTPEEVRDYRVALRPEDFIGLSSITDNGSGDYTLNEATYGYPPRLAYEVVSPPEPKRDEPRLSRQKTVVVIPKTNDPPPEPQRDRDTVPLLR